MRHLLFAGILAASLFTFGCATTGGPPAAPEEPYTSTGEVTFSAAGSARSASFDQKRVVGSRINMSRRSDGTWAGTIADQTVDVNVYPDRVSGVGFTLSRKDTAQGIELTGQLQGNMVRFEILNDRMIIRTRDFSYTLPKTGPGIYGPGGVVKLAGEAASENPPWPQIGLALMGTF